MLIDIFICDKIERADALILQTDIIRNNLFLVEMDEEKWA